MAYSLLLGTNVLIFVVRNVVGAEMMIVQDQLLN